MIHLSLRKPSDHDEGGLSSWIEFSHINNNNNNSQIKAFASRISVPNPLTSTFASEPLQSALLNSHCTNCRDKYSNWSWHTLVSHHVKPMSAGRIKKKKLRHTRVRPSFSRPACRLHTRVKTQQMFGLVCTTEWKLFRERNISKAEKLFCKKIISIHSFL